MPQKKTFFFKKEFLLLFCLSFITLLMHLYSNAYANYGIFRDELYYIACSNRLDLGYVDQPPFSIYVLSIVRFFLGDSVFALRFMPAIAHFVVVLFTSIIVRKMNGGLTAVAIAAISVMLAPIVIGINTIYSMNCIGIMLWAIAAYVCILIIEESNPKRWILLGIIIGIGSLNKIDFLWFGMGVFLGLIFTDERKHLKTKWPYISAIIALLIFSPYIIWNITHDFAHLEFIHNASSEKYLSLTRISFIISNIIILNPFSIFVWLPGLYYYFFHKDGKPFKLLGIIYLTILLILLINPHSKAEYLASAYPVLFAAGGIIIEKISKFRLWGWLKYAIVVILVISGTIIIPNALPILPAKSYIAYANYWGFKPSSAENKRLSELPQFYADMFGWKEMARSVSLVYGSLTPEERSNTVIFANNYGDAGAMEYFKKNFDLPPVVSGHNSYWIWGKEELKKDYKTFIIIGGNIQDHLRSFDHVELAAIFSTQYNMPYENHLQIYICQNLKQPIEEIWPRIRHYE